MRRPSEVPSKLNCGSPLENESSSRFAFPAAMGTWTAIGAPGEDSAAMGIGGDQGDNSAGNAGALYLFEL